MPHRSLRALWVAAFAALLALPLSAAEPVAAPGGAEKGRAEHVVIMVWDGMRPDFVSEEHTPTLAALAREGVTFSRHHSVYPTSTEVNGTALATGCYPNRSGISGNREYRPAIDPRRTVATEAPETMRRGDALSGGKYLAVPTLPERLHALGERTAIAGTKPVARIWDRNEEEAQRAGSIAVFAGETIPDSAGKTISAALENTFPPNVTFPNTTADLWTTRALTEVLWKSGVPKFSVLWLSDPDFSQHQTGPGQPVALAALRSADDCLRRMLAALDAKGVREKTDVFVVSDHGFSTIARAIDIAALLREAGLPVVREFSADPQPGQILANGLGGSVGFYVIGKETEAIRKLVDTLLASDYAGAIFTADGMPGTFALSQARLDSPDAPDVLVALRWDDRKSTVGTVGSLISDGSRRPGAGTHATLGQSDVHNTLIAAGPDFKRGWKNEAPSGNVDIAPTAAWILGVPAADSPMDGRVLREAFVNAPATTPPQIKWSDTETAGGGRSVTLRWIEIDGTRYLDEGVVSTKPASAAKP